MSDFDFSQFSPDDEPEFTATIQTLRSDGEEAVEILGFIAEKEEELKELNARYNHIVQGRMPFIMREIGMSKFELADGTKIKIESFFNGSISKSSDPDAAFGWVDEHGGENLKKTVVSLSFGKGEANMAQDILVDLQERGFDPQKKEDIHPQTLYSFLREKQSEYDAALEKGENAIEIPYETLGVYHGVRAKINLKKGK
jgi:hypothetical protein